jgi:RNA polymerase sigma factor FliA
MDVYADDSVLWRSYQATGDPETRELLVIRYAPLVKFVAGRMRAGLPAYVDQDDLISDGVMGLMDAIEKFEPDRGLQFRTYAVPRIRGAIKDGLRSSDWVPRMVRENLRDIEAATTTLAHRLGRRPKEAELAEEMEVSREELRRMYSQSSYATVSSIELELADGDSVSGAIDALPADGTSFPIGFLAAVRGLPERDRIVVALYYWERLSMAEIGEVLQVSESRVSQLMTRATLELRRRLAA